MKKSRSKGSRSPSSYDPKKESKVKELVETLTHAGYVVRREELKRGLGWKASSGTCRLRDQQVIFVDRRMPLDEQASFLQTALNALNFRKVEEPALPA